MKAHFLRFMIALLCLQASWAQALHLSHAGFGHEERIAAAVNHSGHAHEHSSTTHETSDAQTECQQQHHHHAGCVALIDSGKSSIKKQSTMQLAGSLISSHARWTSSDIDKPKWPATTF